MAIGTSLGQWFPDAFSHAAQKYQYDDKDNNVIDPDLEGNEPTANDKNIIDPVTKTPDFISEAGYKTPNTNFNDRFAQPGSTGELTPEDLQRAGLRYRGVDDRTNETMLDQLSANASALKQWGHNLIHPDHSEPVPINGMARELGYDSIKPDPELEKHSDIKLMYDNVVNDAIRTGRIFKGMYEGLTEEYKDSGDRSIPKMDLSSKK